MLMRNSVSQKVRLIFSCRAIISYFTYIVYTLSAMTESANNLKKPGRNDKCPCGSGMKFKKCCELDTLPRGGVMRIAYENGTSDPFIARMMFQICDIRNHIYNAKDKMDFDKKHEPVMQNLYEAKLAKEKCLSLIEEHNKDIKDGKNCKYNEAQGLITIEKTIDNDMNMSFKDFFIRGNIALKSLIKLAGFLGYNISFAFVDDKDFQKKKERFLKINPDARFVDFCKFIEDDRKAWHKIFIKIRNSIEHDGFKVPPVQYVLNQNKIKPKYFTIQHQTIEEVLNICWQNIFHLCEEIIVFLLSTKLPEPLVVVEIPEDKRNKDNPIRYTIGYKNLPPIPKK